MNDRLLPSRIAILGATSQLARDLIVSLSGSANIHLFLFARRPDAVKTWLDSVGLSGRHTVGDFQTFGGQEFDAIINFVGAGDPARLLAMGNSIFDVTLRFDEMALGYLRRHPQCRYLFLSSGAAYGSGFGKPATAETPAIVPINVLSAADWYGVAKLHAECRHRAYHDLSIADIRVFNYFSHTQDIAARFLIADIMRAVRDKTVLKVSPDNIVRDYMGPTDFLQLVSCALATPFLNGAVDCYTKAPVDKMSLLAGISASFELKYEVDNKHGVINTTGIKHNYYSENRAAAQIGYVPTRTSLENVLHEMHLALNSADKSI